MKNTRTRIKVCGITNPEDARYVAQRGVDALGLVFYPNSPRAVSAEQAKEIIEALPAFITTVGLFVNAEFAEVKAVLEIVPLDVLQFHGDEDEAYCASFGRPYLKALRVKPGMDLPAVIAQYPSAQSILLDAWHKDLAGGTGEQFDWSLLTSLENNAAIKPWILAGGLNPGNVAEAISKVKPYAVDVSSGVETSPGIKSVDKIKQFVDEVNGV